MPTSTLIFDEEANRFETFASFLPEMMVTLGTTLVSFKDGVLYTHDGDKYNNFFGEQFDSSITGIFNQNQADRKTFMNIEEISNITWDCPFIETSSNEYGTTKQLSNLIKSDFEDYEGNHNAAFLKADNSLGGIVDGSSLKGNLMTIKFRGTVNPPPNNDVISMELIKLRSIPSPPNLR